MKITITMKDPDCLYDPIKEAVDDDLEGNTTICKEEKEIISEARIESIKDNLKKWFEYGEYLQVEYDTELKTLTILPNK